MIRSCIQPAIWLGCDPIYIYGLEMSNSYFDGGDVRRHSQVGNVWWEWAVKALEVVRDEMHARDRQIFNLTPETHENVLPKMELSKALEVESKRLKPTRPTQRTSRKSQASKNG